MEQSINADLLLQVQNLVMQVEILSKLIVNQDNSNPLMKEWLPRPKVMEFLGYADTQMATIARKYNIVTTKIGKKVFYNTSSILSILKENIMDNSVNPKE